MAQQERIYLSPPHMGDKEQQNVAEAFESNWISSVGPQIELFEKEMAAYLGIQKDQVLALNSGSSAIHLSMILSHIGPGDCVLCSSFTFAASIFPALYLGAKPVFVDSEADTWNICPQSLEQSFSALAKEGKTVKALVAVSLYGQSYKHTQVEEICQKWNVPIIEDSAEALGASYKNQKCSTLGDFGILSFNGNKIITASGGGMLVAKDAQHIAHAKALSTQARVPNVPHYEHEEIGYNYRMSNILAGIGRGQLDILDDRVQRRRSIFEIYQSELNGYSGISMMPEAEDSHSNRWLSVIRVPKTEKSHTRHLQVLEALSKENIETRPTWKPMHLQPLFAEAPFYSSREKPFCEEVYSDGLCLPSGSSLDELSQERVIAGIKKALQG